MLNPGDKEVLICLNYLPMLLKKLVAFWLAFVFFYGFGDHFENCRLLYRNLMFCKPTIFKILFASFSKNPKPSKN